MRGVARLDLAAARIGCADRSSTQVVDAWRAMRTVLRSCPPLVVGDLAVDGRDLIALGLKPGPVFRDILQQLLDWVLGDPSRNERDALLLRAEAVARRLDTDRRSEGRSS